MRRLTPVLSIFLISCSGPNLFIARTEFRTNADSKEREEDIYTTKAEILAKGREFSDGKISKK